MSDGEKEKAWVTTIFDDVAERYDANRFFTLSAKNLIEYAEFKGTERLLDASTGTGIIALHAAYNFPGLQIEAVDISEGMLNQAKEKAKRENIKNIRFINNDVESLDYTDATFDVITCGYGLFFYSDMPGTFRRLYGSLKPGGKLLFSSFQEIAFTPFSELFFELLQTYGVDKPAASRALLQTPEQIHDLCNRCGVRTMEIKPVEIRYEITVNDWWSLLTSAGYKGLLDQIVPEEQVNFKTKHLSQITDLMGNKKLILIADSYYVIIRK